MTYIYYFIFKIFLNYKLNNGDWGLGIGDWGLGIGPNPQSPLFKEKSFILLCNQQKIKII